MAAIPKARVNGARTTRRKTTRHEVDRPPVNGDLLLDEPLLIPRASDRFTNSIPRDADPARVMNVLAAAFTGDLVAQSDLFERMEETWPRLAKNMLQIKQAVQKTDWEVVPYTPDGVEEPSPDAIAKADVIKQMLQGWRPDPETSDNGFEDAVFDLCDAIGKGISVQEIMWESRDGTILPFAAQWIHPKYYGFPFDSNRIHARPDFTTWQQFVPGKFLIARFKNRSGQTPIGFGLLRPLAWWWTALTYGRTWLMRFSELYGVPFRHAKYDPKMAPARKSELEAMMVNMGSAGYALTPTGTELDIHDFSSKGTLLPQDRIHDLANRECDILLLGQTLTTDVGNSGSRALGDVHESTKDDLFKGYRCFASDTLNYQLIGEVIRQNFGNDRELPYLRQREEADDDPVRDAQRDQILMDAGVEMPKMWLYDRHGIPLPESGEDVVKKQAPPMFDPNAMNNDPNNEPIPFKAKLGPKAVQQRLANNVMEKLTGVSETWLEPVRPVFERLVAMAIDGKVTDNQFVEALELASESMPALFKQLRAGEVQAALERAMGAAMINGGVDAMRLEKP